MPNYIDRDQDGAHYEMDERDPSHYVMLPFMALDDLNPYQLAVYAQMKRLAGGERNTGCFASNKTLAKMVGIGETKLKEVRAELEKMGLIEVTYVTATGKKDTAAFKPARVKVKSIWTENFKRYSAAEQQTVSPSNDNGGGRHATPGGSPDDGGGSPRDYKEESIEEEESKKENIIGTDRTNGSEAGNSTPMRSGPMTKPAPKPAPKPKKANRLGTGLSRLGRRADDDDYSGDGEPTYEDDDAPNRLPPLSSAQAGVLALLRQFGSTANGMNLTERKSYETKLLRVPKSTQVFSINELWESPHHPEFSEWVLEQVTALCQLAKADGWKVSKKKASERIIKNFPLYIEEYRLKMAAKQKQEALNRTAHDGVEFI